jgi:hypothetical protein
MPNCADERGDGLCW